MIKWDEDVLTTLSMSVLLLGISSRIKISAERCTMPSMQERNPAQ
jgi:hypothetical protein